MKKILTLLFWLTGAMLMADDSGIARFKLNGVEIVAFQNAASSMPNSIFSGATPEEMASLAPSGKSPSSINAFLLKQNGKYILFDTGLGSGKGKLLERMQKEKMTPDMIDSVLLTHMHGDHIGGLLTADGKPVFPKADVYVSKSDKEYFAGNKAGSRGILPQQVLKAYGNRIKLFDFNTQVIPGIMALDAAGHTPGHTVYETGEFLIIGDLVHAAALQFPDPNICASFDMDKIKAVAARKHFYEKAAAEGKIVMGMHLPFSGTGKIIKNQAGNFSFQPLTQYSGL